MSVCQCDTVARVSGLFLRQSCSFCPFWHVRNFFVRHWTFFDDVTDKCSNWQWWGNQLVTCEKNIGLEKIQHAVNYACVQAMIFFRQRMFRHNVRVHLAYFLIFAMTKSLVLSENLIPFRKCYGWTWCIGGDFGFFWPIQATFVVVKPLCSGHICGWGATL